MAVYHYMREKPHKFSEEVTASVEKYLQREGLLDSVSKQEEIEPQIASDTTAIVPYI